VRLALGLATTDTTTLPDATIASRLFGPWVERQVQRVVTTWATVIDNSDADYDADREAALQDGVVLWIASRLAALYFARRAGEEVKKAQLGPQSRLFLPNLILFIVNSRYRIRISKFPSI
jgi:hypothetical protein